ncbi:unnamed protein product [Protopolystoma xenopodis]|uniref:Uncharacterized protein n=1 Tax=Protopolystoma xenopodis TaxID=117903 RepID=A0A3S5BQ00_9PLAT|nr:unnamed protein product [Protopolystoma xenopodis]
MHLTWSPRIVLATRALASVQACQRVLTCMPMSSEKNGEIGKKTLSTTYFAVDVDADADADAIHFWPSFRLSPRERDLFAVCVSVAVVCTDVFGGKRMPAGPSMSAETCVLARRQASGRRGLRHGRDAGQFGVERKAVPDGGVLSHATSLSLSLTHSLTRSLCSTRPSSRPTSGWAFQFTRSLIVDRTHMHTHTHTIYTPVCSHFCGPRDRVPPEEGCALRLLVVGMRRELTRRGCSSPTLARRQLDPRISWLWHGGCVNLTLAGSKHSIDWYLQSVLPTRMLNVQAEGAGNSYRRVMWPTGLASCLHASGASTSASFPHKQFTAIGLLRRPNLHSFVSLSLSLPFPLPQGKGAELGCSSSVDSANQNKSDCIW